MGAISKRVMRKGKEYVGKRVVVMDVPGERRNGRLKLRWMDSIKHDLTEKGLWAKPHKTEVFGGD